MPIMRPLSPASPVASCPRADETDLAGAAHAVHGRMGGVRCPGTGGTMRIFNPRLVAGALSLTLIVATVVPVAQADQGLSTRGGAASARALYQESLQRLGSLKGLEFIDTVEVLQPHPSKVY